MLFNTEIDIFLIEKFRYYCDNPCWSHGTTDKSKNEKKIKKSALKKLEKRNQTNFFYHKFKNRNQQEQEQDIINRNKGQPSARNGSSIIISK